MKVAIVIVSYNGRKFLADCLPSVYAQSFSDFDVFLVDNGSSDGTLTEVNKNYPHVKVIENSENLGFARANNIGIRQALSQLEYEYVALVNNDVVLEPRWLEQLISGLEKFGPQAGGCVGKIISLRKHGIIDSAGDFVENKYYTFVCRGWSLKDEGQFDKEEEVFSITAAACLYRRAMLEDLCGVSGEFFDEDFFAYYEDVDFCVRARWLGWKFFYVPSALVHHYGSGTGDRVYGLKIFFLWRNRNWLALKNYPLTDLFKILLRYQYLLCLYAGYAVLVKRKPKDVWYYFKAIVATFPKVPKMLKKRRKIQTGKKIPREELMKWFYSRSL